MSAARPGHDDGCESEFIIDAAAWSPCRCAEFRARSAEMLAQRFHEAYERLAPSFGYTTREASAKPWAEVPHNNRALMVAVCKEVSQQLRAHCPHPRQAAEAADPDPLTICPFCHHPTAGPLAGCDKPECTRREIEIEAAFKRLEDE